MDETRLYALRLDSFQSQRHWSSNAMEMKKLKKKEVKKVQAYLKNLEKELRKLGIKHSLTGLKGELTAARYFLDNKDFKNFDLEAKGGLGDFDFTLIPKDKPEEKIEVEVKSSKLKDDGRNYFRHKQKSSKPKKKIKNFGWNLGSEKRRIKSEQTLFCLIAFPNNGKYKIYLIPGEDLFKKYAHYYTQGRYKNIYALHVPKKANHAVRLHKKERDFNRDYSEKNRKKMNSRSLKKMMEITV